MTESNVRKFNKYCDFLRSIIYVWGARCDYWPWTPKTLAMPLNTIAHSKKKKIRGKKGKKKKKPVTGLFSTKSH